MAKKRTYITVNPRGYEQAAPRDPMADDALKFALAQERKRERASLARVKRIAKAAYRGPWLGDDDPMADPRCGGYVDLRFGRLVRVVGRPC